MAGPAIRYWEFAQALSKKYQVTLLAPSSADLTHPNFHIISSHRDVNYADFDLILTQLIDPITAFHAKKNGTRLIYDAYDPEPLEHLEIFKTANSSSRAFLNQKIVRTVNFSLQMADGIICATEKQRDLWTGSLLSLMKIQPALYDSDSTLNHLMAIVPFGLSSRPPKKTKGGFRELFNFKEKDKLLLWGGGIWNWFDPLTLITAMKSLSMKRKDIKLVFMGLIHPNAATIPAMSRAVEAKQLAASFGLLNETIFFNEQWIPYEERENYLLEAAIGISTHCDHLETRYSFRTRILDYMWAGLPIVSTAGDFFSEFIEKYQIGLTVAPYDAQALEKAIVEIIDHPQRAQGMRNNMEKIRPRFFWEQIVHPLENMVDALVDRKRSPLSIHDLKKICMHLWRKAAPYALYQKIKNQTFRM